MVEKFVIAVLLVYIFRPSICLYRQTPLAENISDTLNGLLLNYDKHIRPDFEEKPTLVKIDLNIRSMGPISEQDMVYSFDCYFRQTWRDKRLQFIGSGKLTTLQLNERMLHKIWKPDTYVYNGRGSYLHNITSLNILFRIQEDGSILYSMRLTIKASCPMHLQKFPMDKQMCPLIIGSHGYVSEDLVYQWKKGAGQSVEVSKDLSMSQFDLKNITLGYDSLKVGNRGYFSMLTVAFELERNMGYFLIQLYVPCTLLVILSWVGFWINREATSDRIALGITTVLTMAFLGMDSRQDLPRVSYSTALDIYLGICFAFILATIIQFSAVHYFTKHGSGEIYLLFDSDDEYEEVLDEEEINSLHIPLILALQCTISASTAYNPDPASPPTSTSHMRSVNNGGFTKKRASSLRHSHQKFQERSARRNVSASSASALTRRRISARAEAGVFANLGAAQEEGALIGGDSTITSPKCDDLLIDELTEEAEEMEEMETVVFLPKGIEDDEETTAKVKPRRGGVNDCCVGFLNCLQGSAKYQELRRRNSVRRVNSVSTIDQLSRVGFPLAFSLFNLFYWVFYLKL